MLPDALAAQLGLEHKHLPYSNTRLVLASEVTDDDYFFGGTVVRCFLGGPSSHPAVRQALQGLEFRRVGLGALAVQAIVNKRGPDGIVGVIPGEEKHSARLLELCQQCHDNGEVLACTLPSADVVLVPRLPGTAAQDGLYFLAYATCLRAVELCERLRQESKVAVVLDLDNTLVDAVSCTIAPNDWDLLDWRYVLVTNSYGRQIKAQYAPLPGPDPFSDDVWVMHWKVGRVNCTFKVRVRRGWADLRAFLAENAHRFEVFVCSKGKREYIQLLWLMLDPAGQLIPQQDWDERLTSTFPDTLAQAANKTALTALGCYDVNKPHVPTQVALPMMCLDDSTEAYEPEYEHNLMYVAEYRPSDLLAADNGNVLRQARGRLEAFWTATCAAEGSFAWQAAQSFAVALMKTMQRNPMASADDLSYLQVRCAKQGEALWHQFTVHEVFGEEGVFIADDPSKDVPRQCYVTPGGLLCTTCQLAPCKPGCPGSAAGTSLDAVAAAAAAAAGAEDGAAVPMPVGSSPVDAAARLAPEEAALSEGRSSEDSVLLGLPSPTYSVLPRTGGPAVSPLAVTAGCGDASMAGCSAGSSPTADSPAHKHARLAAWDAPLAGGGSGADTATDAFGWGRVQQPAAAAAAEPAGESPRLPSPWASPRAPTLAAAPPQPPAAESALAAALRGISKGLADDEGSSSNAPPRQSVLPPARPPARWEAAAQPAAAAPPAAAAAAAQPAAGGGGGGGGAPSALAAALASISKGLAEDGLL